MSLPPPGDFLPNNHRWLRPTSSRQLRWARNTWAGTQPPSTSMLAKAFDCWKPSFYGIPMATSCLLTSPLVPLFRISLLPGYVTTSPGDTPSLLLCLGHFLHFPNLCYSFLGGRSPLPSSLLLLRSNMLAARCPL